MNELHIGQVTVPYEIEWNERRSSIELELTDGVLQVRAPFDASRESVQEVLDSRKDWILKSLYGLHERNDPPLEKEFLSGEKLPLNGRQYRLSTTTEDVPQPQLSFDGSQFDLVVPVFLRDEPRRRAIRDVVIDWYISRAESRFDGRIDRYATQMGVTPAGISVQAIPNSWGECHSDEIRLHWRLVLAPTEIQDYVIVHELAHLKHGDHSPGFWNTVGAVLPDYERRKEWLRVNGSSITV